MICNLAVSGMPLKWCTKRNCYNTGGLSEKKKVLVVYFSADHRLSNTNLLNLLLTSYRNDRKFSDRQVLCKQCRPSLISVYTVCHSVCIFWTYYSTVKPSCSNFKVITANFSGVRTLRSFTVYKMSNRCWCGIFWNDWWYWRNACNTPKLLLCDYSLSGVCDDSEI